MMSETMLVLSAQLTQACSSPHSWLQISCWFFLLSFAQGAAKNLVQLASGLTPHLPAAGCKAQPEGGQQNDRNCCPPKFTAAETLDLRIDSSN
jgi:hypothetical protein